MVITEYARELHHSPFSVIVQMSFLMDCEEHLNFKRIANTTSGRTEMMIQKGDWLDDPMGDWDVARFKFERIEQFLTPEQQRRVRSITYAGNDMIPPWWTR